MDLKLKMSKKMGIDRAIRLEQNLGHPMMGISDFVPHTETSIEPEVRATNVSLESGGDFSQITPTVPSMT